MFISSFFLLLSAKRNKSHNIQTTTTAKNEIMFESFRLLHNTKFVINQNTPNKS